MQGRIVSAVAGFYYVASGGMTYQTRARGHFRKKGKTPYVGDWVTFSAEADSEGYILEIHPRKNSLVRPPIVNIDQAIVLLSVKEPDFSYNLLDRFLVLLEHKGIRPIIYLTKCDLLEDTSLLAAISRTYTAIGYEVIKRPEDLIPYLKDKITVFMGQTGVGKSTLINTLDSQLHLETGEISESLGRGKHTTRQVTLYPLCGGRVADTPGFSSLDYEVDNPQDLSEAFCEIRRASSKCKFRTCTHTHEPDCYVKILHEAGQIADSRYHNYRQLLSEVTHSRQVYRKTAKNQKG